MKGKWQGLVRINQNENSGDLKERHMIKCEKMSGSRKKMTDDSEKTDAVNVFFASLYSFSFFSRKRRNEAN